MPLGVRDWGGQQQRPSDNCNQKPEPAATRRAHDRPPRISAIYQIGNYPGPARGKTQPDLSNLLLGCGTRCVKDGGFAHARDRARAACCASPARPGRVLSCPNLKRVLITGMSGVGKSSLLSELAARGYRTVDTDYGGYYETVDGERLWREDRIHALLSNDSEEHPSVLFVQGTTWNQALFYPRFDHVVLLSAPAEVLVQRLTRRTTNPYGKDPAELAETLENLETVEPLLRTAATLEVVTTVPVTRVADIVLEHVL
ncbi:MAG TPA: AAA family ATPase [Thermoleophilaceae bacterium]|nr:AAA family ATPase [Thermoleophilaceae bacterium]